MTQYIKLTTPIKINITPRAFHMWAEHYYKCKQDFKPPSKFSPVPYFLLCRAIELELKSRHLHKFPAQHIKTKYDHHLLKSYKDLDINQKTLSDLELTTLKLADKIYSKEKGFEYFQPQHALVGYSTFPDLNTLDTIAIKLLTEGKKFFPWFSLLDTPLPLNEWASEAETLAPQLRQMEAELEEVRMFLAEKISEFNERWAIMEAHEPIK